MTERFIAQNSPTPSHNPIRGYFNRPKVNPQQSFVIPSQQVGMQNSSIQALFDKNSSTLSNIANQQSKHTAPITLMEVKAPNTEDIRVGTHTNESFEEHFMAIHDRHNIDFSDPKKPNQPLIDYFKEHPEDSRIKDATLSYDGLKNTDDKQLFNNFRSLVKLVSVGDMEKIALDMVGKVEENKGGEYKNKALNQYVKNHSSSLKFMDEFKSLFSRKLKKNNYKIEPTIKEIQGLNQGDKVVKPVFNSNVFDVNHNGYIPELVPGAKWGGLGISIHDTMGYKVDLLNYSKKGSDFEIKLKLTTVDYFGLDIKDIEGTNWGKEMPMMIAGKEFVSWYYLQHVRGYKPLKTTIENEYVIKVPAQSNKDIAPIKGYENALD